jgi:hypothetical protein
MSADDILYAPIHRVAYWFRCERTHEHGDPYDGTIGFWSEKKHEKCPLCGADARAISRRHYDNGFFVYSPV